MSMKPQEISPVPEETARVARAANPKGTVYTLPTMLRKKC
jgi:transposase